MALCVARSASRLFAIALWLLKSIGATVLFTSAHFALSTHPKGKLTLHSLFYTNVIPNGMQAIFANDDSSFCMASTSNAVPSTSAAITAAAGEELKRLHPRAYLSAFVKESYRPDGRQFTSFRSVDINVGSPLCLHTIFCFDVHAVSAYVERVYINCRRVCFGSIRRHDCSSWHPL